MTNLPHIISEIDKQIAQLTQARAILSGATTSGSKVSTPLKKRPGRPLGSTSKKTFTSSAKKRTSLSPEARERIATAQKKRWAKVRAAQAAGK